MRESYHVDRIAIRTEESPAGGCFPIFTRETGTFARS